jgi:hypothetical protein
LSRLLNSTGDDGYSDLSGPELVRKKVSELAVMGGEYPMGYEFNFWGDNPFHTRHVIHTWKDLKLTPVTFLGFELGNKVKAGEELMAKGPKNDPVRKAYLMYTYGVSRPQWDPLLLHYAIYGLGDLFEYGNKNGYNHIHGGEDKTQAGANTWIDDEEVTDQRWLKLKVEDIEAVRKMEWLLLDAAQRVEKRTPELAQVPSEDRGVIASRAKL